MQKDEKSSAGDPRVDRHERDESPFGKNARGCDVSGLAGASDDPAALPETETHTLVPARQQQVGIEHDSVLDKLAKDKRRAGHLRLELPGYCGDGLWNAQPSKRAR